MKWWKFNWIKNNFLIHSSFTNEFLFKLYKEGCEYFIICNCFGICIQYTFKSRKRAEYSDIKPIVQFGFGYGYYKYFPDTIYLFKEIPMPWRPDVLIQDSIFDVEKSEDVPFSKLNMYETFEPSFPSIKLTQPNGKTFTWYLITKRYTNSIFNKLGFNPTLKRFFFLDFDMKETYQSKSVYGGSLILTKKDYIDRQIMDMYLKSSKCILPENKQFYSKKLENFIINKALHYINKHES